jgi:hypothetical protein
MPRFVSTRLRLHRIHSDGLLTNASTPLFAAREQGSSPSVITLIAQSLLSLDVVSFALEYILPPPKPSSARRLPSLRRPLRSPSLLVVPPIDPLHCPPTVSCSNPCPPGLYDQTFLFAYAHVMPYVASPCPQIYAAYSVFWFALGF